MFKVEIRIFRKLWRLIRVLILTLILLKIDLVKWYPRRIVCHVIPKFQQFCLWWCNIFLSIQWWHDLGDFKFFCRYRSEWFFPAAKSDSHLMQNISLKIHFQMVLCFQKMLKTLRRTKAYKTMPQAAHYPVKKTPMLPEGCFDGKVAFSKFEKF